MGRLFWKFFLCILLAQFAATVGIGGAFWLKNLSQQASPVADIDTSPPAEMAIGAAAATLEFGGAKALRRMIEGLDRRRVYAVDDQGRELLGRTVSPALLRESRLLLVQEQDNKDQDNRRRVVRQVTDVDGVRYLLFLPANERQRGPDGERPLLANLSGAAVQMSQLAMPRPQGQPGQNGGPPGGSGMGTGMGSSREGGPRQGGQDQNGPPGAGPGQNQGPAQGQGAGQPGVTSDRNPGGDGGDMRVGDMRVGDMRGGDMRAGDMRGPMGPRFQPMTPWIPLAAAILASLLFSVLLAWYFSRPIRALRQAFDAAAGGDLSPRFVNPGYGTELNDLGRDFDRMTARLRNLIDGQTRLLHDVSHELRSPLARLQAAIGLAHQQPDKLGASMERIERESVRMDKLVGELLTLARLEAGAIKASEEEISMADLLEQIADDAEYEAASQQRTVVLEGEADVTVMGQPDLLCRAIENVVRNAIKHTHEGGEVRLQLQTRPELRQLHIRVLDRGPGVAPADLELIFEPFYRSSNANAEGHGLGLAIAQHVLQAHGGSISASNRTGGGLCVEIRLPVRRQGS